MRPTWCSGCTPHHLRLSGCWSEPTRWGMVPRACGRSTAGLGIRGRAGSPLPRRRRGQAGPASDEEEQIALSEGDDLVVLADKPDVVVERAGQAGRDGDPVPHDPVGLTGGGLHEVAAAPDPPAAEVPL